MRTSLVPVGIYYATDYIFLFQGTDMFKLFISILIRCYCLCSLRMFLLLLLFYEAISIFRLLRRVRICFVMSILNFKALICQISSSLQKKQNSINFLASIFLIRIPFCFTISAFSNTHFISFNFNISHLHFLDFPVSQKPTPRVFYYPLRVK